MVLELLQTWDTVEIKVFLARQILLDQKTSLDESLILRFQQLVKLPKVLIGFFHRPHCIVILKSKNLKVNRAILDTVSYNRPFDYGYP